VSLTVTRPTGGRTGFTLIELLIVLVVIGLLAALAIPKFQETKRVAQLADMKAALRKTALDMELRFADQGTYSVSDCPPDMACAAALPDEAERTGVSVTVDMADGIGWRARAISGSAKEVECLVGGGAYVPDGQEEGVPGGPNCK
jgi:prepilin-type N-terminal cleavage/methylation domain-containing protein